MIARSTILDAMLYDLATSEPAHTTDAPAKVFTYQFAGTSQPGDLWKGYSGWTAATAAERAAIRAALDHIETLINVEFVEVSGQADPDLNFGKVSLPGSTAGYGGFRYFYNSTGITGWDGYAVFDNTIDISTEPSLILHEIGHALALKHPFDAPALPAAYDSNKYTVMSYDPNPDNGMDSDAMQLFDIFALQAMWGRNDSHAAGDDIYTGPRNGTVDAIWDIGGEDMFDATTYSAAVRLDLRPGRFSQFEGTDDVVIAYGVRIEHAAGGSGDDRITGNTASNSLWGGRGDDRIAGGEGRDWIDGSDGIDRLFGDEGRDRLYGGGQRDYLDGGAGDDLLVGGGGRDSFDFAPGMGRDILRRFQDDLDTLRFTGFGDAAAVLATARQSGDDVVFSLGNGDRLTVEDMRLADLSDDVLAF